MRPRNTLLADRLRAALISYDENRQPLIGIRDPQFRESFLEQLIESVRRIGYIQAIAERDISTQRIDPASTLFDPERGAIFFNRQHNFDEACWLVFLAVHFGKNRRSGWRLCRDIYGRLGSPNNWDWNTTSANPAAFGNWLHLNLGQLRGGDGIARGFGNHRKYLSLDPFIPAGTGAAVETYINWIGAGRGHMAAFQEATNQVANDPKVLFNHLFQSMNVVASFGRTAKFDYLTMLGKIGLVNIVPGSTYLHGATGPVPGAKLLFSGVTDANISRTDLEAFLVRLDQELQVGMQAFEDALCNWQKSPGTFRPFRG